MFSRSEALFEHQPPLNVRYDDAGAETRIGVSYRAYRVTAGRRLFGRVKIESKCKMSDFVSVKIRGIP